MSVSSRFLWSLYSIPHLDSCVCGSQTCVIVNTIADNLNLKQGAVSKALLQAAGPGMQSAVRTAGGRATHYGDVVITNGFNLSCRKVFHAVCPFWDQGAGKAENVGADCLILDGKSVCPLMFKVLCSKLLRPPADSCFLSQDLSSIIRYCLDQAEKLHMQSLSFPAIGTGNLNFPRDLVCKTLLTEIHKFSSRRAPRHLKEVFIVVHPSDAQTADVSPTPLVFSGTV